MRNVEGGGRTGSLRVWPTSEAGTVAALQFSIIKCNSEGLKGRATSETRTGLPRPTLVLHIKGRQSISQPSRTRRFERLLPPSDRLLPQLTRLAHGT